MTCFMITLRFPNILSLLVNKTTAYKVLTEICERHTDFVTSSERLNDLIDLMVESIVTAQVSARNMRLKCITVIVGGLDSSNEEHMVRLKLLLQYSVCYLSPHLNFFLCCP